MYHPAPAVKRGHLRNIKTHGLVTLVGVLQIKLGRAEDPPLFRRCHCLSRGGQRIRLAGLYLAENQCPVWFPQDEVDLPYQQAVVVGHQQAALFLVKAGSHSLPAPADLCPVHLFPSGQ